METSGIFSKTLDAAQRKYSTFNRELLAVFLSLKHFKHTRILQGRDLNIVTDHQPLVKAFRSTNDNFTPRQTRHLSYIAEFTGNVEFINGFLNIASDALSRADINAVSLISEVPVLPLTEIVARLQDAEFEASLSSSKYQSLLLEKRFLLASKTSIIGDTSKGTFRVVVPTSFTTTSFWYHALSLTSWD